MKLRGGEAKQFLARPDPARGACLVYGADPEQVRLTVDEALSALLGPNADEEMRLTRLTAADLKSEPGQLADTLRATGFFPGQRAVLLESAGDGLTDPIKSALDLIEPGMDAFLFVTAGILPTRSKLRKLFEAHADAVAAPLYADAPDRNDILNRLGAAGVTDVNPDALSDLEIIARDVDLGTFRQLVSKISLYALGQSEPLGQADVAACAIPGDPQIDDLIGAIADGRVPDIGPAIRRIGARGNQPTSICIATSRYFRQLHAVAISGEAPQQAVAKMRPPVFGPRRDALLRHLRVWAPERLEWALSILADLDLKLRASSPVPAMALTERALLRISMHQSRR